MKPPAFNWFMQVQEFSCPESILHHSQPSDYVENKYALNVNYPAKGKLAQKEQAAIVACNLLFIDLQRIYFRIKGMYSLM